MNTIPEAFNQWSAEQPEPTDTIISKMAGELVEWSDSGVLADGAVRSFANFLKQQGYGDQEVLRIAESHVKWAAVHIVAASRGRERT